MGQRGSRGPVPPQLSRTHRQNLDTVIQNPAEVEPGLDPGQRSAVCLHGCGVQNLWEKEIKWEPPRTLIHPPSSVGGSSHCLSFRSGGPSSPLDSDPPPASSSALISEPLPPPAAPSTWNQLFTADFIISTCWFFREIKTNKSSTGFLVSVESHLSSTVSWRTDFS